MKSDTQSRPTDEIYGEVSYGLLARIVALLGFVTMKLLLVLLALGVRQGHGLDIMKILTGFYHPEALQAVPDLDQILNEHSFRFFEDGKHILESMRPESIRKMIGHVML